MSSGTMDKTKLFTRRLSLIVAAWIAAGGPGPAAATDLPAYGGGGGGSFYAYCARSQGYLVGISGRTGDWVDAIQAVCARYDPATQSAGAPAPVGDAHGGGGGGTRSVMCPPQTAVKGWEIGALDNDGQVLVQYVHPYCQPIASQPGTRASSNGGFFGGNGATDGSRTMAYSCPEGELAVGLYGASGAYVDRVGLICQPAPLVLGRPVTVPAPPGERTTSRPAQVTESAASAHSHASTTNTLPPSVTPARARGVTYDSPMIVAANGQTVMLDFCREWGSACGKPAADAFCRQKGHPDASRFQISDDIGQTAIITSRAICSEPSCDGFTKIECNP